MLIRSLPDEQSEPDDVTPAEVPEGMWGRSREPVRRLWESPAGELLHLRGGHTEVQSPDAAVLLGDLRSALEDIEIPEHYR